MKTNAVRSNGGWVLNGSKNFITHGISGDTCVVLAITNREMRSRGISAFIVERGMKGFLAGKKENKLGVRASETASIIFEDCWIPEENLLGEQGAASSMQCRFWMAVESRSRLWRLALRRARSKRR